MNADHTNPPSTPSTDAATGLSSAPGDQHHHAPADSQAGDGILNTLADLENRVSSLKQLHAQSTARTAELLKKESDLARRESALAEREGALHTREHGLADRESGIEQRLADSRRVAEEIEQQQRQMSTLEATLEDQRRQIAEIREQLEKDTAALDERAQQNTDRERHAQEHERKAHDLERETQRKRDEIDALQAGLTHEKTRLAGREQELASREKHAAETERDAELTRENRMAELETWAAAQRKLIDGSAAELSARRAELERQEKDLAERARQLVERENALDRRETDLDHRMKQVSEQNARMTAQTSRLERMEEEHRTRETQIADERARLSTLESELSALKGEFDERRSAFEHEVDVTRSSLQKREEQVGSLETTIRTQQEEIKDRLDELDRERAKIVEQQRTLMAQAQSEHNGAGAISSGRLEMLQIQIGEANALRAAAEEELAQARSECQNLQQRLTELQQSGDRADLEAEISKRDHAIMVLRERLQELQTAHAALKEKSAAASSPAGDSSEAQPRNGKSRTHTPSTSNNNSSSDPRVARWLATRRKRLARYKALLQQQARKVMSAQAGLQKRHSECEQILAQRQKLSTAAQELAKREKRIANAKARSGAFVGILCATITIGVLGLLSWQVAQRIFPGQYIARATIKADAHGRQATNEELNAWQDYHEELVTNPQYFEVSAERMNRRGIVTLSRAADLSAKLKKDLYVQSAEPGELTLEIKEEGSGRAEMVLDTLVTALKSVSDASREQRSQDLGVTIVSAAVSEQRPLNEKTLMGYAGGIFGGAILAVGLFGTLIWSRLISSKRRFDQSQAVEEALSDVDWASLEQSLKRSTAGESPLSRIPQHAQPSAAPTAAPSKPAAQAKKKKDRN